jgi:hypothetical protein
LRKGAGIWKLDEVMERQEKTAHQELHIFVILVKDSASKRALQL